MGGRLWTVGGAWGAGGGLAGLIPVGGLRRGKFTPAASASIFVGRFSVFEGSLEPSKAATQRVLVCAE